MEFIDGEKIIMKSDGKLLVLTTHRVRYESDSINQSEIKSILLNEITFCAVKVSSRPIFLLLAIVSFAMTLLILITKNPFGIVALIAGVVFLIAYRATKREILEIASSGGAIQVRLEGVGKANAEEFIDALEIAKLNKHFVQGYTTS